VTIVVAMIYSHFFAAVVQTTSVSTTSSAITMAIIALKIYFLWEYRHYRKLMDRRTFLYVLMGLIVGINLIPLFVVNNVDYSAHLGNFSPLFRRFHCRRAAWTVLPPPKDRRTDQMRQSFDGSIADTSHSFLSACRSTYFFPVESGLRIPSFEH